MSADIELKLALSPKQLARLRDHALLRGYMRPGAKRTRLVKTYYDTPKRLLHDHAVVLGVEKSGDRRIQTVASPDGFVSETAQNVSGDAPDVTQIADGRWRKLLAHNSRDGKLAPVFTTEVERSRLPLQVEGSRIDLAFETGHIRAKGREQPICEARLALIAGQPERLYRLALELHDLVPFHIEHRDSVMRGYGLLAADAPTAVKAADVGFAPDATVGEAFHALAQSAFTHLCANEDIVLRGDNPEAVHQMRVAARRLRALLAAFHAMLDRDAVRFLRAELRWLQNQLGPARDWDVFRHGTLEPLMAGLHAEPSLAELRSAVEATRREAYDVARDTLRDRRYTRLLLRFRLWLDSVAWEGKAAPASLKVPVASLADSILGKRYRKLEKLGNRFAHLDEAEMHEVRLRAKKLRYAAEFFQPVYSAKGTRKFIHALVEIQDTLGSLHDAIVGRDLLKTLKSRQGETRAPDLERAAGIAAGFQAARIGDDIRRFGEVWPRFIKLKKFWRKV
jgi:inorganic triphosphatase YgiF